VFALPNTPPGCAVSVATCLCNGRDVLDEDLALFGICGSRSDPEATSRDVTDLLAASPSPVVSVGECCAGRLVAASWRADAVASASVDLCVPRSVQMAEGVYCCAVCFMTGSRSGGTGGGFCAAADVLPDPGANRVPAFALRALLRPETICVLPTPTVEPARPRPVFPIPAPPAVAPGAPPPEALEVAVGATTPPRCLLGRLSVISSSSACSRTS